MNTITQSGSREWMFAIGGRQYEHAADVPFHVLWTIFLRKIVLSLGKRRGRRDLMEMTPAQLSDIGVTPQVLAAEVRKSYPFWYFEARSLTDRYDRWPG